MDELLKIMFESEKVKEGDPVVIYRDKTTKLYCVVIAGSYEQGNTLSEAVSNMVEW